MSDLIAPSPPCACCRTPQDVYAAVLPFFLRFFSAEELVTSFRLLDLDVKELILLKEVLVQEIFRQLANAPMRDALRARFREVYDELQPPDPQAPPAQTP